MNQENVPAWWSHPDHEVTGNRKELRKPVSGTIAIALIAGVIGGIGGNYFGNDNISAHNVKLVSASSTVERQPDSIAGIAARVLPSVVSIMINTQMGGASGSGFVIRSDGYILTNNHVVAGAANQQGDITVTLNDGKTFSAKILGRDAAYDLAVLKISATGLSALQFGDSDAIQVGDNVIAIGSPLGLSGTVTSGIISAKNRAVTSGTGTSESSFINALQTDAAINPGNSGGPLLNLSGEVVGVNTAVSQRGQLIGFSLPMNSVARIIENAVKNGRIIHPWLGVRYHPADDATKKKYNITEENAAIVTADPVKKQPGVVVDSPAAKAGMKEGDIITAVNAQALSERHTLALEIAKYSVGDTIQLSVYREGVLHKIMITLEEFPKQ